MPPDTLPLTPAAFQILLALADGEQHGYAIMKEVAGRPEGGLRLGAGTLYGTLNRLLAGGLVEEAGERADADSADERRRYYRITTRGLKAARAEARRLEAVLVVAWQKKLIGPASA